MAKDSAEATRLRILQQTLPLFADAGFDGVSMRAVGAATGLTTAALYYHFPDKEQLYLAVVEHCFSERVNPLLAASGSVSDDPWQRIEGFAAAFTDMLAHAPDFQRLMQWLGLDRDEARSRQMTERIFEPFFGGLRGLLPSSLAEEQQHFVAVALMGLLTFPFETDQARRLLPGYVSPWQQPQLLVRQVVTLLKEGLQA